MLAGRRGYGRKTESFQVNATDSPNRIMETVPGTERWKNSITRSAVLRKGYIRGGKPQSDRKEELTLKERRGFSIKRGMWQAQYEGRRRGVGTHAEGCASTPLLGG